MTFSNGLQIGRDAELDALASSFGLTREQTEAGVAAVLPEISRRLERNTLSRGGVADLIAMMGQAAADAPAIGSAAGRDHGNALLEQVFGTRDQSRAVAQRAAATSGIGASIIQAMLPYIIQMVMGSLMKGTSGGLGDILSKIPELGGAGRNSPAPAPRTQAGGGAPVPFPAPRSGRQGGGIGLPGPEGMEMPGRNPYGDLSDIIRDGGRGVQVDGNPLWRVVRNVLGSALGFQSRGVVSWIVRMVIMRYGWRILSSVLRRAFTGR